MAMSLNLRLPEASLTPNRSDRGRGVASLRWRGSMFSAASRSAKVRATWKMRSWARADRRRQVIAVDGGASRFEEHRGADCDGGVGYKSQRYHALGLI